MVSWVFNTQGSWFVRKIVLNWGRVNIMMPIQNSGGGGGGGGNIEFGGSLGGGGNNANSDFGRGWGGPGYLTLRGVGLFKYKVQI